MKNNKTLLIIAIIIILLLILVMARRERQRRAAEEGGQTQTEETTETGTEEGGETSSEVPAPGYENTSETEVVGEGEVYEEISGDASLSELEEDLMEVDTSGTDPDLDALEVDAQAE